MVKKAPYFLITTAFLLLWMSSSLAQTTWVRYRFLSQIQVGNPSGVNTDSDTAVFSSNQTRILGPSIIPPRYSSSIALPFSFVFYGDTLNAFCVSPTGVLTFDTSKANSLCSPVKSPFSTNSLPAKSIAAFWADFPFQGNGTQSNVSYKVYGNAPNRQFWIHWNNISLGQASNAWFSLVLEEGTNFIWMVDKGVNGSQNLKARMGVKKSGSEFLEFLGSDSLNLFSGTTSPLDNRVYKFFPVSTLLQQTQTGSCSFSLPGGVYPNPYGKSYKTQRHQFILTKAELQALRQTPLIARIALNIQPAPNATPPVQLSISLANTGVTDLASLVPGAVVVAQVQSFNLQNGWNTIELDRLFKWDTTQNLLVEYCSENGNFGNTLPSPSIFGDTYSSQFSASSLSISDKACQNQYVSSAFTVLPGFRPCFQITGLEENVDVESPVVESISPVRDSCFSGSRSVRVTAKDNGKVVGASLLVKTQSQSSWDTIPMQGGPNVWTGLLSPRLASDYPLAYSAIVIDSAGNRSSLGPVNYFRDSLSALNLYTSGLLLQGNPANIGIKSKGVRGLRITEIRFSTSRVFDFQIQKTDTLFQSPRQVNGLTIELQNFSRDTLNLAGYSLWFGLPTGSLSSFTFPTNSKLLPGRIAVVASASGISQLNKNLYFLNLTLPGINAFSNWGVVLRDPLGAERDQYKQSSFQWNQTAIPFAVDSTLLNWSFAENAAGIFLTNLHQSQEVWIATRNGQDTSSIGYTNPRLFSDPFQYNWYKNDTLLFANASSKIYFSSLQSGWYKVIAQAENCIASDSIWIQIPSYCIPAILSSDSTLSTLRIASFRDTIGAAPYENRTQKQVIAFSGLRNAIFRFTKSKAQPQRIALLCDYNLDGDFLDSSELILNTIVWANDTLSSVSFKSNIPQGNYWLRWMVMDTLENPLACQFNSARVRDYVLNVRTSVVDQTPPLPGLWPQLPQRCQPASRTISIHWEDDFGIDTVWLHYRPLSGQVWSRVQMLNSGSPFDWVTTFPAQAYGAVSFFSSARDFAGNVDSSSLIAYIDTTYTASAGSDLRVPPPAYSINRVANTLLNRVFISEILLSSQVPGAQTTWPQGFPYNTIADAIEICNHTNKPIDISGYRVFVETPVGVSTSGNTQYSYTFPSNTILNPTSVVVLSGGAGVDDTLRGLYFMNNGNGNMFVSNVGFAIALLKDSIQMVDQVRGNGFQFSPFSFISNQGFSGFLQTPGSSTLVRVMTTDTDGPVDWAPSDPILHPPSLGTYNVGFDTTRLSFEWKNLNTGTIVTQSDTLVDTPTQTTQYQLKFEVQSCVALDTFEIRFDSLYTDMILDSVYILNPCLFRNQEALFCKVRSNSANPISFQGTPLRIDAYFDSLHIQKMVRSGILSPDSTLAVFLDSISLKAPDSIGIGKKISVFISIANDAHKENDSLFDQIFFSEYLPEGRLDTVFAIENQNITLEANLPSSNVMFTEIVISPDKPGIQSSFPSLPNLGSKPHMIEFYYPDWKTISLSRVKLELYGSNGMVIPFQFPQLDSLRRPAFITVFTGTGTPQPNLGLYYLNSYFRLFDQADAWIMILKVDEQVQDVIRLNPWKTSVVQPSLRFWDWIGPVLEAKRFAGFQRKASDTHSRLDWYPTNTLNQSTLFLPQMGIDQLNTFVHWEKNGVRLADSTYRLIINATEPNVYAFEWATPGFCRWTHQFNLRISPAIKQYSVGFTGKVVPVSGSDVSQNDTVFVEYQNKSNFSWPSDNSNLSIQVFLDGVSIKSDSVNFGQASSMEKRQFVLPLNSVGRLSDIHNFRFILSSPLDTDVSDNQMDLLLKVKAPQPEFSVFPNPSYGRIVLRGLQPERQTEVRLLDASSRLCQTWFLDEINQSEDVELFLEGGLQGVYTLIIKQKEGFERPIKLVLLKL